MMESGIFLEEKVQEFCTRNNQDEGYIWGVINNIHTRDYGRNLMWEKQKEEAEKDYGDIPMSQQFAKENLVHRAIDILKGLEECAQKGWELK